jgi:tetratricopeptide (TPR) repeat protein
MSYRRYDESMRALILLLAWLTCNWPAAARADDQQLARVHYQTALHYYDQSRYSDALKEFEEAYRLSKRVGFLYNIGICDEKLGRDDDALAAFQGYLGSVADESERAEVQSRIDALKAKRAPRTLSPPTTAPTANPLISAPPPTAQRPVWKRGWFWGVMAGAAVVVAAGVSVGVVVGTADHGPRTLNPVTLQ